MVRGSYSLPKGTGKSVKVIVFAEGAKAQDAKDAGADEVGSADLAKKILDGWMDFDITIATPDMMKHVGRLGKVLGPQGKMPSPKTGTVTQNVRKVVEEYKAGKIEFRNDKAGNVHVVVGQRSFSTEDLAENVNAFIGYLNANKPTGVKGTFILNAALTTTQSPSVKLAI